jgi:hydrogenase-4 component F
MILVLTLALVLVPALAGVVALAIRADGPRRALLVGTAALHALMAAAVWGFPVGTPQGWFFLDALGRIFLSITSALFLLSAVYAVGYLRREAKGRRPDLEEDVFFSNAPEAVFIGCLLLFLSTMSLVTMSQHMGLLWVAIEATTLASAPLIYFHRHHRSLEATWKYLMICSVGIALSLLGNFFLAVAASSTAGAGLPLEIKDLVQRAGSLHIPWLKASFLFLLVGYGTKMGLAPLHTWLPDAHSEAPSVVSALMSGALLNCAALGILRSLQICAAAGEGRFGQELLIGFGLLSMTVATVFLIGQLDYKRMLAYSSVEHMGILALGVGLGGAGTFGAILHAVNHSLAKAMLFLVSGNILAAYNTKSTSDVRGLLRVIPFSGALWFAGFLAITGSPPFGPFLSEFTILKAAIDGGRYVVAGAYLVLLGIAFVAMTAIVLRMSQGRGSRPAARETLLGIAPPAVLGVLVLSLGLYVPPALRDAILAAARSMGLP